MKILPPETHLPSAPLRRQHLPEPASYSEYRQCLRWEFGFSCAFCLLHEADLIENGIEGTGFMGIEHRVTRSSAPTQEDAYGNCYYACRFCFRSSYRERHGDGCGREHKRALCYHRVHRLEEILWLGLFGFFRSPKCLDRSGLGSRAVACGSTCYWPARSEKRQLAPRENSTTFGE